LISITVIKERETNMHPGIIFLGVIVGSVLFHIYTPWWWTDIASNWGAMDDTINLTFWIGGGVFILVCLFMVYCILKFSYKEGEKLNTNQKIIN